MTTIYLIPHQKCYKEQFLIYLQVNACFFMRLCSVSIHRECQLLASRRLIVDRPPWEAQSPTLRRPLLLLPSFK